MRGTHSNVFAWLILQVLKGITTANCAYLPTKMAGLLRFSSLAPKTKNVVVAGGLTVFVFGVYFYTMRAVGGTDELQVAIDKFEDLKSKQEADTGMGSKA
ncbi:hypothetical protein L1049_016381 [Liquidambar formosana]|uniref:Cytochrome c oxidase assembly factor 3 mitochondrial coiled-coil domain-containing protein n=1 Tax=Liquidambar formosana TaxID=63359 RepID=A0AAP0X330_LIQFO